MLASYRLASDAISKIISAFSLIAAKLLAHDRELRSRKMESNANWNEGVASQELCIKMSTKIARNCNSNTLFITEYSEKIHCSGALLCEIVNQLSVFRMQI